MHNLPDSRHTLRVLASALLAISFDASLDAQAPATWNNLSAAWLPDVRAHHAMAYDSLRGVSVLFGGLYFTLNSFGDTWEWDGSSWTQVATTGPPARAGHKMAYDSLRGVTVLFGGADSAPILGDTWEWDGTSWTQVATSGPGARESHAMAYDSARGVTVLFGGRDSNSNKLGDTWEWDGTSWTQVATTGPSERDGHAMAYDSARGVSVVFGGFGTNYPGDTWEWDGNSWTQVTTAGPSVRVDHAMAYDSLRGVTVVFGGQVGNPSPLGDTWEWDGNSWTQVATTGPSGREGHAMAYDSLRDACVLYGGRRPEIYYGDTWAYRPTVPAGVGLYGSGCGNPSLTFVPISAPALGSTAKCVMAQVPAPYLGAVALGFSNSAVNGLPLPIELSSIGLPGCFQYTSAEANPLPVTAGMAPGMLEFQLTIPNDPSWLSAKLYMQAYCLAPSYNPGGAIVSNGIEWTIGDY